MGGFPALSHMPGQFLLKDLVLLGAAIYTAGEALSAARPRRCGWHLREFAQPGGSLTEESWQRPP